jgi:hypothetical protein
MTKNKVKLSVGMPAPFAVEDLSPRFEIGTEHKVDQLHKVSYDMRRKLPTGSTLSSFPVIPITPPSKLRTSFRMFHTICSFL